MLGDKDVCATIAVSDLDAAEKFYGGTLGLEAVKDGGGGVFYKSGNSGIFIYQSSSAGTNKATYAAWSVDDVEATAKELEGKGVKFEQYDDLPGERQGNIHIMGDIKSAWFTDPEGNILNIVNGM
ncbi:MAG TPA: VOC family protein [Candidatus Saccharimonadales bacterium]|nr:VOC family protein [Candidatus Saccharimonadales bacterium]